MGHRLRDKVLAAHQETHRHYTANNYLYTQLNPMKACDGWFTTGPIEEPGSGRTRCFATEPFTNPGRSGTKGFLTNRIGSGSCFPSPSSNRSWQGGKQLHIDHHQPAARTNGGTDGVCRSRGLGGISILEPTGLGGTPCQAGKVRRLAPNGSPPTNISGKCHTLRIGTAM